MIRVLVANDDGINAAGLRALVKSLSAYATVYVAAPSEQQSAKSRAMTYRKNLVVEETEVEGAEAAYAVHGTPADCVLYAICRYEEEFRFDFVFSGINMGHNCGGAVYYSGTLGAAIEASQHGVRAIAMSVDGHETNNFEYVCSMIPQLMELSRRLPVDTVVSVNGPDIPAWKVKGVKFVDLKPGSDGESFRCVKESDGVYNNLAFYDAYDEEYLKTDFGVICSGYVAVSPVRPSMTASDSLALMTGMAREGSLCIFMNAQQRVMDRLVDSWVRTDVENGAGGDESRARAERKAHSFVNKLSRFGACARRLDMPVILAEQYGAGDTFHAVSDTLSNYEKVQKDGLRIVDNKDFSSLLSVACDKRAILAGGETHLEILAASRGLREKGFDVTVLEDCCTSANIEDHRVAIDNMRFEGCHIETLESYMLTLVDETNHPAGRRIRALLRGEE